MRYEKIYKDWLSDSYFADYHEELKTLDAKEIEERFYQDISFGTAGLRGKVGAGTNRMNVYTVAKTTQGLAHFIQSKGQEAMERGVVIARDSRLQSQLFCDTAASVLCANGIKVYLFEDFCPTPMLSFAIRYLNTISGIVVTASHNPPEYNGYKLYWEDGAQVNEDIAEGVAKAILEIKHHDEIRLMDLEEGKKQGKILFTKQSLLDAYMAAVLSTRVHDDIEKDVSIVYTPLHGVGGQYVLAVLEKRGFGKVQVVEAQAKPDGHFPTVSYPNPEDPKAFELAISLGKEKRAEILMATDPDSDRMGVLIRDKKGDYVRLNGNQTGSLLIHYILEGSKDKLPANPTLIKTVVTSDQGAEIAKHYGLSVIDTLTGFKNIAYELRIREGQIGYVFGYEESFGYMPSDKVRDKDGIMTCMLFAEMAGYYKKQGKTILDVLQEIYEQFGYYEEDLMAIVLEGKEGKEKIEALMAQFRKEPIEKGGTGRLSFIYDYLARTKMDYNTKQRADLSVRASDVLKYRYDNDAWFAMRPSGTEPKLKIYFSARGQNLAEAREKLGALKQKVAQKLKPLLQD